MLLNVLLIFLGFAAIFAITAGLAKDSKFLVPMAGILVLSSAMLLTSDSLYVQDGYIEIEEDVSNVNNFTERGGLPQFSDEEVTVDSTVKNVLDHTPTYEDLNQVYTPDWPIKLSTSLALIFLAIALYSFILAYLRKY